MSESLLGSLGGLLGSLGLGDLSLGSLLDNLLGGRLADLEVKLGGDLAVLSVKLAEKLRERKENP